MTTLKDLELLVKQINEATGSPLEAYTKQPGGSYQHNPTAYHLDGAYGGWKLARGNQPITTSGYTAKRALYAEMRAYLAGLELPSKPDARHISSAIRNLAHIKKDSLTDWNASCVMGAIETLKQLRGVAQ